MRSVLCIGGAAVASAAGIVTYKAYKNRHDESSGDQSALLAEVLQGNEKLFNAKEQRFIAQLIKLGQRSLFESWPAPGTEDAGKRRLVAQLQQLDTHYPKGIAAYISNARQLLKDAREGKNAFEGFTPSVPHGERLDFGSPEFLSLEQGGLQEAGQAAFVLVAGGLGERLGYSGIKVALPCESATGTSFLGLYAAHILALQARSASSKRLPFAIMTSDDTHAHTQQLLEENSYYGLDKSQVTLIKQEKVACLVDNEATLGLDPKDPYAVQTKPHGHGDVHALLHTSGLAKKWQKEGFKWVCFFQDTNALVFRGLVAALGASARHDYDMNSLAVPRKAQEAIGAITTLRHKDGRSLTINVEYNQLDPLLRSTIMKDGDVNDATGWSPFPGNINQLVLKLSSYTHQLERTGGIISEFVNPKYKDSTKTAFKSSTRLECMMQDYPKALPHDSKVGFTTINQVWASYSPVKNSPQDALAKQKQGNPTHSATTGELDIYRANCAILAQQAGVKMAAPQAVTFNGLHADMHPVVVLQPSWAPLVGDVKTKVKAGAITLHPGASLVIDGEDIIIEGPLEVRGALVLRAGKGVQLAVRSLSVSNAGWTWRALGPNEDAPEEQRIRGFCVEKHGTTELSFMTPGSYILSPVGDIANAVGEPPAPAPSSLAPPPPSAPAPAPAPPAPPAAPPSTPPRSVAPEPPMPTVPSPMPVAANKGVAATPIAAAAGGASALAMQPMPMPSSMPVPEASRLPAANKEQAESNGDVSTQQSKTETGGEEVPKTTPTPARPSATQMMSQFRTSTLNSKAPEFIPSYVRAAQQQQQQGSSSSRGSTVPGGEGLAPAAGNAHSAPNYRRAPTTAAAKKNAKKHSRKSKAHREGGAQHQQQSQPTQQQ
uniref:UTP-monosaccharide-1-phosphate uridylyltransferase n=1 Tax=Dunaliella tertiolecta TaxID=3047 RepID=A0A7S3VR13_DUNTE|mmetsp:Transcript_11303/g.30823  ORF Transcript_11303/g.30823 Transcript_11303/m.30823 type:complete len:886 (+) Transcript_11303:108-2765(+)